MNRIRVLLVDDSRTVLELLQGIIAADPRLEVVGVAESAEEALRILHRVRADVISMDIRLPGMNGFEATQRIMAERPTPIVVVSASIDSEELNITMNALRAGALTVVEKPVGTAHPDYRTMADRLCTQLVIMSEVKVVRQRTARRLTVAPSLASPPPQAPRPGVLRMVGMVASTGGPSALVRILGGLEAEFPWPILLVQHIIQSFLPGFVEWLNGLSALEVVVAREHEVPTGGKVYLAPADHHLCLERTWLHLSQEPPVDGQRPSGTVLFQSMASSLGSSGIGVLLTGMGADGAEGLLAMRRAGGYTMAEDATTAVVYGMPAEAVQRGAVCESLPLQDIGPRLLSLTATAKSAS